MKEINYNCPGLGNLKFIGEKFNQGNDFRIKFSGDKSQVDILIFFDSRGIGFDYKGSLAEKFEDYFAGKNLLVVCRPLELTIWATFINFLKVNEINPELIITNMGFVDFTPKKISILEDAIAQTEFAVGKNSVTAEPLELYKSSAGELIELYGMKYSSIYRDAIEEISMAKKVVCLETPLLNPDIKLNRERPQSFFEKLKSTNTFNHSISKLINIALPQFNEELTYDGVHYTNEGNNKIFKEIIPWL